MFLIKDYFVLTSVIITFAVSCSLALLQNFLFLVTLKIPQEHKDVGILLFPPDSVSGCYWGRSLQFINITLLWSQSSLWLIPLKIQFRYSILVIYSYRSVVVWLVKALSSPSGSLCIVTENKRSFFSFQKTWHTWLLRHYTCHWYLNCLQWWLWRQLSHKLPFPQPT